VADFTFDSVQTRYRAAPYAVTAEGTPFAVHLRGIMFDGETHYLTLGGLMLHHTFTIALWLFAENPKSMFSVTRVGSNDIHLLLSSTTSRRLTLLYNA
jgi:hypothetical protein